MVVQWLTMSFETISLRVFDTIISKCMVFRRCGVYLLMIDDYMFPFMAVLISAIIVLMKLYTALNTIVSVCRCAVEIRVIYNCAVLVHVSARRVYCFWRKPSTLFMQFVRY